MDRFQFDWCLGLTAARPLVTQKNGRASPDVKKIQEFYNRMNRNPPPPALCPPSLREGEFNLRYDPVDLIWFRSKIENGEVVDIPVCGIVMGKKVYFDPFCDEKITEKDHVVTDGDALKVERTRIEALQALEDDLVQVLGRYALCV